jgi:pimeloyl-ACP methyl ester carboxylesterase
MSEANHYDRRRFIGTAVMATAGAGLGSRLLEPRSRDESSLAATEPRVNGSQGPIKPIDAGDLNVAFTEAGPSNGPPAILLHGSRYGINSDVDVAPLAARGYRVIVPYVRSAGTKRFARSGTMRNGQQTAVAPDVIALMDALKIEKALVGGFDDGVRTADVMAALWPHRVKGIVPVSGYVVVNLAANQRPLPPKEELEWWYRYYFVRDGLTTNTNVQWNRVVSRANVYRVHDA